MDDVRRYVAQLDRQKTSLGKQTFGPTHKTKIEKPQPGHKTCGAAAHSQQVAFEECSLALEIHLDGHHFMDLTPITQSWAAGLVRTGQIFLAVL